MNVSTTHDKHDINENKAMKKNALNSHLDKIRPHLHDALRKSGFYEKHMKVVHAARDEYWKKIREKKK